MSADSDTRAVTHATSTMARLFTALVAMTALALTACGGSNSDNTGPGSGGRQNPQIPTPPIEAFLGTWALQGEEVAAWNEQLFSSAPGMRESLVPIFAQTQMRFTIDKDGTASSTTTSPDQDTGEPQTKRANGEWTLGEGKLTITFLEDGSVRPGVVECRLFGKQLITSQKDAQTPLRMPFVRD